MKERLITGAGFWTATAGVLVVAFGAVVALPYLGSGGSQSRAESDASAATPRPGATHAKKHSPAKKQSTPPGYVAGAAATMGKPAAASAKPSPGSTAAAADPGEEPFDVLEVGRLALAQVGTDADAEAVWLSIINDPSIDPEDRKDLIEDLNEEGFADPKNLTPADLPLIEARIALLDRLMPEPMDDTNAAAFAEARKDLVEMRGRLKPTPSEPNAEPSKQ